jgi:TM2 domain-containing membrane protein YozV
MSMYSNPYGYASNRRVLIAFLLCFFLGYLGVHRFYAGKIGTGLLWLFTGGLFGIGWFIDTIVIVCGAFRDGDGLPIREWV